MTWKSEAKDILRRHYEGYCSMCRKLNIDPVPYRRFTPKEYTRVKTFKNNRS